MYDNICIYVDVHIHTLPYYCITIEYTCAYVRYEHIDVKNGTNPSLDGRL